MAVQKVKLFILLLGTIRDIVIRASDEHLSRSSVSTLRTSWLAICSRVKIRTVGMSVHVMHSYIC